jgi:hypothetical protein
MRGGKTPLRHLTAGAPQPLLIQRTQFPSSARASIGSSKRSSTAVASVSASAFASGTAAAIAKPVRRVRMANEIFIFAVMKASEVVVEYARVVVD